MQNLLEKWFDFGRGEQVLGVAQQVGWVAPLPLEQVIPQVGEDDAEDERGRFMVYVGRNHPLYYPLLNECLEVVQRALGHGRARFSGQGGIPIEGAVADLGQLGVGKLKV